MTITSATSSSPAFSHCKIVAGFRLEQQHEDIDQFAHDRIALPGADRLDQHDLETERLQQADQGGEMFGQRAVTAGRGQTADENAVVVRPRRHAKAIAEQGAAAQRTLRIASQHGDASVPVARICSISLPTSVLLPTPPLPVTATTRAGVRRFADAGKDFLDLFAARYQADQSRQGQTIAAAEAFQQCLKHGRLRVRSPQERDDVRQRRAGTEDARHAHVVAVSECRLRE